MKKFSLAVVVILLFACGSKTSVVSDEFKLYEILKQDEQGGANIRFFEIITEPHEFKMLLNDDDLKRKVSAKDILTSNFLLLNMGEKTSGGYSITVGSVEETTDNIIVTIKETAPSGMATSVMTYPMTIVKINSKKDIIIQ